MDDEMNPEPEPATWEYYLILERVQTAEGLESARRADFRHHAGLELNIPLAEWITMGRPNTVTISFTDGGAHAPVGA